MRHCIAVFWCFFVCADQLAAAPATQPTVTCKEFIFERAPCPSVHASTIARDNTGDLVAAWFGGTAEGAPDVGIWLSVHHSDRWSTPVEVAKPTDAPCWNPVLFAAPSGRLLLFYKVGPNVPAWRAMLRTSNDNAKTWSAPAPLPAGFLGPIKDKPVLLCDGDLLCPSSSEAGTWSVHLERTADWGAAWTETTPLADPDHCLPIQPTILVHSPTVLQILCRSKCGRIVESWSNDAGRTWSAIRATLLPNPNSGIDAVTLDDGRFLLVYNRCTKGRTPLNVAISSDGEKWLPLLTLEDQEGEYSYPAVIQTSDGLVHVTYTWKREKIRHVVLKIPG